MNRIRHISAAQWQLRFLPKWQKTRLNICRGEKRHPRKSKMPTLRGIWPNLEDKILIRFGNQPINKVSCNSQNISPGDLFVAIKGASCDGHQFIDEAIRRGARIIVSEEDKDSF